jgi:hypothetical protein
VWVVRYSRSPRTVASPSEAVNHRVRATDGLFQEVRYGEWFWFGDCRRTEIEVAVHTLTHWPTNPPGHHKPLSAPRATKAD